MMGVRSLGLGGAFTAVADDPTAVWHNPAGTAFFGDNAIYLSGELVITQRGYQPSPQSPLGQMGITNNIVESGGIAGVPTLGFSTRFGGAHTPPSRFSLSLLGGVAYGGQIAYKPADVGGLGVTSTTILDYEIAVALAYQLTDAISLGAAVRLGINQFGIDTTLPTQAASLSGFGVGVGGTLAIIIRPHPRVSIGATYRTPLSASVGGNGPVTIVGMPTSNRDFSLNIPWPQSASLGVAVRPHARVMLSVQGDWTGWSSIQKLVLSSPGLPDQPNVMRYMDTLAFHAGIQVIAHQRVALRCGYTYDANAIPDETMRRENQDGPKNLLAIGAGVHVWKLFIDAAFEALIPTPARNVATQGATNEAGRYAAHLYTAALSAQARF
jgi:long-chain fatty acid transport protein